MFLETLLIRMPAPAEPVECRGNWNDVEAALGVRLPEDYKEFITRYGSGVIWNFLVLYNPFSPNPYVNLPKASKSQLAAYFELRDKFGDCQFPLFPEEGGLLPMGQTDNGDIVSWLTAEDPADWTIVVNETRSPDFEHFDCGLAKFLEGLLKGSIRVNAFPDDLASIEFAFRGLATAH